LPFARLVLGVVATAGLVAVPVSVMGTVFGVICEASLSLTWETVADCVPDRACAARRAVQLPLNAVDKATR
jgi:hypothetical protein